MWKYIDQFVRLCYLYWESTSFLEGVLQRIQGSGSPFATQLRSKLPPYVTSVLWGDDSVILALVVDGLL